MDTEWIKLEPKDKKAKKPKHIDYFRQARIKKNEHIPKEPPDKQSFRSFWRKHQPNLTLFSRKTTRKQRRYLARFLYHKMMQEDKMSILDKERAS